MTDNNNKRRAFRIEEPVLFHFEVIEESDFEMGLDAWKIREGKSSNIRSKLLDLDSRLLETMYRVRSEAPAAASALELLNTKLMLILETLPEYQRSIQSLAGRPSQNCDISADGMTFCTHEELPIDTKLFLRFLLTSENRYFESFCEVTRIVDDFDFADSDYSHCNAVEFHEMHSTEREILIQHLFIKQSESLRRKRHRAELAESSEES